MSKKEKVLSARNIADKPEQKIEKSEVSPPTIPDLPVTPPPIDRSVVPDQSKPKIIPPMPAAPQEPPPEPVKRYKYVALVVGISGRSDNKSSKEVASWFELEAKCW